MEEKKIPNAGFGAGFCHSSLWFRWMYLTSNPRWLALNECINTFLSMKHTPAHHLLRRLITPLQHFLSHGQKAATFGTRRLYIVAQGLEVCAGVVYTPVKSTKLDTDNIWESCWWKESNANQRCIFWQIIHYFTCPRWSPRFCNWYRSYTMLFTIKHVVQDFHWWL